jgi:spore maturation protein CgeD
MLISCILTSYNRPRYVRQALKSLENQTFKDFEVLVFDDSSCIEIEPILKEFKLTISHLVQSKITAHKRASVNRLSVNINRGLALAKGDLVCFLADDDYYFPGWFRTAVKYFMKHPEVNAAYGKLLYSHSGKMEYNLRGQVRWPGRLITNPYEQLDHNQVIHRRFDPPYRWPEEFKTIANPDAHYFKAISKKYPFYPIQDYAAVKRLHQKNLQKTTRELITGQAENLRE